MSNAILCGVGGGGKRAQEKEITITENGVTVEVLPDDALMSKLSITVDVRSVTIDGVIYTLNDTQTEYDVDSSSDDGAIVSNINGVPVVK